MAGERHDRMSRARIVEVVVPSHAQILAWALQHHALTEKTHWANTLFLSGQLSEPPAYKQCMAVKGTNCSEQRMFLPQRPVQQSMHPAYLSMREVCSTSALVAKGVKPA